MTDARQPHLNLEVDISGLSDVDALNEIGLLIDAAHDAQSIPGTDRAFALLDELQEREIAPEIAVRIHYYRANAWENRRLAERHHESWKWEQHETQEQVLELRRAIRHHGFNRLDAVVQCQILTNLANQLNSIGRFIDAMELWDRTLRLNPRFAMARGNRGRGLSAYAQSLYDPGHAKLMFVAAYDALLSATAEDAFYETTGYDTARAGFEHLRERIAECLPLDEIRNATDLHRHSLGRSAGEKAYRSWCLAHRLFINPLNDLDALPIAAHDVLTLPSITVTNAGVHPPEIIGFFNQIKQEFVSARFLCYEGLHPKSVHFSDRGVRLYNTLDYPVYSLSTEKLRAAFRVAYSLLDKVAFFINDYFAAGLDLKQVSFRSVWYESAGRGQRPLRPCFAACPNWPLRGLFWLSKDLFQDDFQAVTEPHAEALNEIRNHLEHRYLQLHETMGLSERPSGHTGLVYGLSRGDFEAKTLRLIKLARAALIHLSLAVHREEEARRAEAGERVVIPLPLDLWRDEWRR